MCFLHLIITYCSYHYADESHSQQLDELVQEDEPDVGDNYLEGLDHAGLVVWEFSEDEDEAVVDEW